MSQPQSQQHPQHPYLDSINSTAGSTHDTQSQPLNFEEIIRDAIIDAIWNGDVSSWDSATLLTFGHRALKRDFTPNEIYKWVNENPGEIDKRTGRPHTDFFHNGYLQGSQNWPKKHKDSLKQIVIGRKRVLDKYKKADEAKQSEIDALERKFKLPDDVRDWLKQQKLTDDEKMVFNLMQSADSSAGSSADAGGRRRRKTSFRRRRMSRYRSSKSKSKSKKSRKSRKCVR